MCILVVLYIRMGLKIRETSEIQRNLPVVTRPAQASVTGHDNNGGGLQQQAASNLSASNTSIVNGANLRLNADSVMQSQERQLNASKRAILRMLGNLLLVNFEEIMKDFEAIMKDFESIMKDFEAVWSDFEVILKSFCRILECKVASGICTGSSFARF